MRRMKAILLLTAALAFFAAPFFVSGFAGFDPALFPIPQENPPVQPAGWAFAIWGVIYVWLVVHAGYGLLAKADDAGWDAPRWPLMASLAIGVTWLSVATFSPIWAEIEIFAMLALALWALAVTPAKQPWLLSTPIALYAGWLTAASFAGLGITGAGFGLLWGPYGWAVACILGALLVGLTTVLLVRPNPAYAIALCWALIAIAVRNWGVNWDITLLAGFGGLTALAATARSYWLSNLAHRA